MNIQIQSIHFDAAADLLKETSEKLQKLEKLSDRIENCIVMLKKEKGDQEKNFFVEVRLVIPQEDLFANERATNFSQALDHVLNDLKKQLIKRKEKNKEFNRNEAEEIN